MSRKQPKTILKEAIKALPKETHLYYIGRGEELNGEQVAKILGGQSDSVWEDIQENWDDSYAINTYLDEAVKDEDDRQKLKDSDLWNDFVAACQEVDASTPMDDLMRETGRVMIRFMVGKDEVSGEYGAELEYGSYAWDGAREEAEARKLAAASKLDYEVNKAEFLELVQNATGGGNLCVLAYVDVSPLAKAVEHLVRDHGSCGPATAEECVNDKAKVRLTFTDPELVVYDGNNGSGHGTGFKGEVVIEFGFKDLRPRGGVMQVDQRDAKTGYSWSEDIAGLHKPAFEASPKIELL